MDSSTTAALVESTDSLEQHHIFEALRNSRRRFILMYLYQAPQQSAPISELIDELAACKESNRTDPDHRTAVYVSVHQNHLPRMEQFELIEQDQNTRLITLTDAGHVSVQYLQPFFNRVRPWPRLVRVFTVFAVVLFVLAVGNVLVLTPALSTVTQLVTTAFVFVSIGYYLDVGQVDVAPCRVASGTSEQSQV